jgi:hypothetical protein
MSYRDFTMDRVRHEFGITARDHNLFEPVGDLIPSPWLRDSLHKGLDPAFISEKARGEFIVAPILLECRERMQNRVNIFSGVRLDVAAAPAFALPASPSGASFSGGAGAWQMIGSWKCFPR